MRFTELADHVAHPGLLTEWRARAAPDAQWRRDHRPVSYVQEAHLREAGTHPSWLGTAFDLPGALDRPALRSALSAWVDRHEVLRSRLCGARGRSTACAGAMDLRPTVVGVIADGARLSRHVERLFDQETNPLAWPPFVCATVERPDSCTVYVGLDHSVVDGYSIALVAHEIRELYAGRGANLGAAGSYLDFGGAERVVADHARDDHASVAHWRDFLGGGAMPDFPGVAPGDHAARQHGRCDWLLTPSEATAFDAACRASGGNFPAGVLAALAAADPGYPEFRTAMLCHTRDHPQWARSVGWYVGLAPVSFPVGPFDRMVREAATRVKHAKTVAALPLPRVAELLGTCLRPRFVVSCMDVRLTPGARMWTEWHAHTFRSGSWSPDEVYLWVNRTHDGVYVSSRFPGTTQGAEAMHRYVARLRDTMRRVAAHDKSRLDFQLC